MENIGITLNNPKYECPFHGKIEHVLSSNLGEVTEYFCLHCIIGLLKQRLQPIKLSSDEGSENANI